MQPMSEPGLSEPPTKRQRADKEDAKNNGKSKGPDDDEEFHQLTAVSVVQEELNVLDEEEAKEVLIVHKAYLKRKRPLYARRQAAIAKVPDFWLKVLLAYPLTQPYVSDCDQFALSFLEAISVSKALVVPTSAGILQQKQEHSEGESANDAVKAKGVGGKKGPDAEGDDGEGDDDDDDGVAFRVVFTFKENPFFSNKQLWKEWESPEAQQAAFSEVEWKDTEEAKELQSFLVWNLDPNAAEESDTPSFFSIFCEDVEDYELGESLRGEITDNPLDIYLRHDFEEADEDDEADQEGLLLQGAFAENGKPGSGEDYPEEDDLDDAEEEDAEIFDEEEDCNGRLEDETQ